MEDFWGESFGESDGEEWKAHQKKPLKGKLRDDNPWDGEPDKNQFDHCGLECAVLRNKGLGNLCGYVEVPFSHPLFGVVGSETDIRVHGGITYSEVSRKSKFKWIFGFDCAHWNDVVPLMRSFQHNPDAVYRDMKYVTAQTKKMAYQLSLIKWKGINRIRPIITLTKILLGGNKWVIASLNFLGRSLQSLKLLLMDSKIHHISRKFTNLFQRAISSISSLMKMGNK